jgi:hypothetical protein
MDTAEGYCPSCHRRLATEEDEGAHNTGECGCDVARSLCWFRWNGNRCLPMSIYDSEAKAVNPE